MNGETCDICGKVLLADEDVRYIARIEVFAAYDPLELTAADVAEDRRGEIEELLKRLEGADERELQDQVYRQFVFDLCPGCQRKYLSDPLGVRQAKRDSG